jgi:hypothetical protein
VLKGRFSWQLLDEGAADAGAEEVKRQDFRPEAVVLGLKAFV